MRRPGPIAGEGRPDAAFGDADPARWHYSARPDLEEARREHDAFVDLLREAGAEIVEHPEPQPDRAVLTYRDREISLKAEGGPTCLTRPVWRE